MLKVTDSSKSQKPDSHKSLVASAEDYDPTMRS